jgi:mannitol/fructose-specific phosphotransferase system IIA component
VHCIVRADNGESAMRRIKSALEEAGYWKESYINSILFGKRTTQHTSTHALIYLDGEKIL